MAEYMNQVMKPTSNHSFSSLPFDTVYYMITLGVFPFGICNVVLVQFYIYFFVFCLPYNVFLLMSVFNYIFYFFFLCLRRCWTCIHIQRQQEQQQQQKPISHTINDTVAIAERPERHRPNEFTQQVSPVSFNKILIAYMGWCQISYNTQCRAAQQRAPHTHMKKWAVRLKLCIRLNAFCILFHLYAL